MSLDLQHYNEPKDWSIKQVHVNESGLNLLKIPTYWTACEMPERFLSAQTSNRKGKRDTSG